MRWIILQKVNTWESALLHPIHWQRDVSEKKEKKKMIIYIFDTHALAKLFLTTLLSLVLFPSGNLKIDKYGS